MGGPREGLVLTAAMIEHVATVTRRSAGESNERVGSTKILSTVLAARGLHQGSGMPQTGVMMPPIFENEGASGTLRSLSGVVNETLLTPREVAEMLRVPISWVYERTRHHGTGRLPHIKIGKYLRFRKEDVLGWLDEYRI
jgi:excisionase family DNA binding protein